MSVPDVCTDSDATKCGSEAFPLKKGCLLREGERGMENQTVEFCKD